MGGFALLARLDGAPPPRALLEPMTAAAPDRAPTGWEWHSRPGFACGAARASPLGAPATTVAVHGGITAVADGRVDGRDDLRRDLRALGNVVGPDATSAELVLASWRTWGRSCPEHLLGDFAFAIWNADERRLFCARDVVGARPLHFRRAGPLVAVASDARQILPLPGVSVAPDPTWIARYLCADHDSRRSPYRDVRPVAPATSLEMSEGGHRIHRYWFPEAVDPEETRPREQDAADRLAELLGRAVADRLPAGTPAGVMMSGGLDSTAVAAFAAEAAGPGRPRLLTLAFPTLPECDETRFAGAVADRLGLPLETVAADAFGLLAESATEENPFRSWEAPEAELLRRLAEGGSSVLLTGHGGDLVAGGPLAADLARLWAGKPEVLPELVAWARRSGKPLAGRIWGSLVAPALPEVCVTALRRLAGRADRRPRIPPWVHPELVRATGLDERLRPLPLPAGPRRASIALARVIGTPGPVHRAVASSERLGAARGIEVAHPFLDRRLLELALEVPPWFHFRAGRRKLLLRRATRDLLPESVRNRDEKTVFVRYVDSALRERHAARIDALLHDPRTAAAGWVLPDVLRRSWEDLRAGRAPGSGVGLWFAVTLEEWLRRIESGERAPGVGS